MPNPQFIRNVALAALLLGVIFMAANLYLGTTDHSSLAKMFFVFAILFDVVFTMAAVLWALCSAWVRETPRPGAPMPGAKPGPGAPAQGAAPRSVIITPDAMPGGAADKKPRPPQG
jgi:hypothetical protein